MLDPFAAETSSHEFGRGSAQDDRPMGSHMIRMGVAHEDRLWSGLPSARIKPEAQLGEMDRALMKLQLQLRHRAKIVGERVKSMTLNSRPHFVSFVGKESLRTS